ncbi:hypothetical protein ACFL6S_20365 [Candidatus Poribacteria bacterium]
MYTYKRFRISKSAVTFILISMALVAWWSLGLTGTPLAEKPEKPGKATFLVGLELRVKNSYGESVSFGDGYSKWPKLGVMFRSLSRGGDDHHVPVGSDTVDLIQMSLSIERGCIVSVGVFFEGIEDNEGTLYSGWKDIEPISIRPEDINGFEVFVDQTIDVHKAKGRGNPGNWLGTVYVEKALYTRTN